MGGEDIAGLPPFPSTQEDLYEFYYRYEKYLTVVQKSILNAVLEGLGTQDQSIAESSATPRQIAAAGKIVRSVLRRLG